MQSVRHVLVECKEAAVAEKSRVAWGVNPEIKKIFRRPKRLLDFWKAVPDRLLWR